MPSSLRLHRSAASPLVKGGASALPPVVLPQATSRLQHPTSEHHHSSCSKDVCSATFASSPPIFANRISSRTVSQASPLESPSTASAGTTTVERWWKAESELWVEVTSEQDFQREVLQSSQPVAVDFYATWCHGCQKAYPEICKVVRSPELRKYWKFVKVCVDSQKVLANREGINSLPKINVYLPGEGRVVNMEMPFSKVKNLKANLDVIRLNPGRAFAMDPNGFVVALDKKPDAPAAAAAAAAAKAAAAAELSSNSGGLFKHLMGVATAAAAAASQPTPASGDNRSQASSTNSVKTAATVGTAAAAVSAQSSSSSTASSSNPRMQAEKEAFLRKHRSEYGYNGTVDELYPREVGCRMGPGEHYLDYTGSSVYCQSQLEAVFEELRTHLFGNPHSANPSSMYTGDKVEEVREIVLRYFKADPTEYQVVFTRSATGALKMVGETFPWSEKSLFRYLRENHNSVLGIREYALKAGGSFEAVDEPFVEAWTCDKSNATENDKTTCGGPGTTYSLFAFPAEDNFAGVKYPLDWVKAIKAKSTESHQWLTLVDAAAYVPTQPFDLSKVPVDFVDMSFYKMFGYPTGVGALIVRTEVVPLLNKVFWGGGTVALATSHDNFHVLKCKPSDKLEDGTVAFLDIIALKHGFAMIEKLGGIRRIQSHVAALTEYLYERLSSLKHSNGAPMVAIFGKHHQSNHREVQGGILNFEVLKPDGSIFSYKTVEREAAGSGLHVRTGAECNPGACYNYLGVQECEVEELAGKKEGCQDDLEFIKVQRPCAPNNTVHSSQLLHSIANTAIGLGHPAEVAMKWVEVPLGSVRASLGYMSTFEDCYALVHFIESRYKDRME